MGVSFDGFNDLEKYFENLQKKAEEASGDVKFSELFNSDFMKANTNSDDIESFFKSSPFEITTQEEFGNLNEKELDKYVKSATRFNDWEEMKTEAGKLYMKKKLGL